MFDPKTMTPNSINSWVSRDPSVAAAVAAQKPKEIERHLDGTPKRAQDRYDEDRAMTDQSYFDRSMKDGSMQAAHAERAEEAKAERQAEERKQFELDLSAKLAELDARDRAEEAKDEAKAAIRREGVFRPVDKKAF